MGTRQINMRLREEQEGQIEEILKWYNEMAEEMMVGSFNRTDVIHAAVNVMYKEMEKSRKQ